MQPGQCKYCPAFDSDEHECLGKKIADFDARAVRIRQSDADALEADADMTFKRSEELRELMLEVRARADAWQRLEIALKLLGASDQD
jgi:hypothetical protein